MSERGVSRGDAEIDASVARLQGKLLREALTRALRASLLSSLGVAAALEIAACAPPKQVTVYPSEPSSTPAMIGKGAADAEIGKGAADAGQLIPPPDCNGGSWRLAEGFRLARPVDYVADRNGDITVSERGTACASAENHQRCLMDLKHDLIGRNIATTEGDVVRLWPASAVSTLFGDIDSVEEALFILAAHNYSVPCASSMTASQVGYSFTGASRPGDCMATNWTGTVEVVVDGSIAEVTGTRNPGACGVSGRRAEGLLSEHIACGSLVGDHFATVAHLEAAAVPAFAAIARELAHHGAPHALQRAAWRARQDEVLHARLTSRLARRHHARSTAPVVQPMPLRDLYAFALDNAIEGCVHETYAALEAAHQALHAQDPAVRATMQRITADETRHAELAWQIARWVAQRLRDGERREIRERQLAAVEALGERLRADAHPAVSDLAGLPSASQARALHASLARDLWRSSLAEQLA
jgi:hypothetical protein